MEDKETQGFTTKDAINVLSLNQIKGNKEDLSKLVVVINNKELAESHRLKYDL